MRKSLEDLIFIGKLEQTFTLYKREWKLRTLTSEEQVEATASTSNYDTFARINALKVAILGRALVSIDNEQFKDMKETLEFVSKIQLPILNKLYEKYEELQKEQTDQLEDIDELKN